MKLFEPRRYPRWFYEHPARAGFMFFSIVAGIGCGLYFLKHRQFDIGPILAGGLFGVVSFLRLEALENPYQVQNKEKA
jgi:hypothetical protein